MELKDYWATIRKRWITVIMCVAACVGLAVLYTVQATPVYSSDTKLFVSTTPSSDETLQGGQLAASQRVASYADLVKTRKLANTVSDNLGNEITPDRLRDSITASVVPETVGLSIVAQDADPVVARDIAQAYGEALVDLVADIETPAGKTVAPIRASVVDDAEVSSAPISPNPTRNIGLGIVLGLLLGVGLAVARDLLDTSVTGAEDVAQVTSAPILGHISQDASNAQTSPFEALRKPTPWAESFRVLRTNMQYVEVDHDHRMFVISSAVPAEGKSTTGINLAVTLALAGQRVALIECDLRRPLIAKRMQLDGEVGTTSVLIGAVPLKEAIQSYGDTGLDVLACGPIPPNPSELLQSNAMERLISELRATYDVVLLDAPPLLPVTDAALLTAQADGLLAVVRHGKTSRDQLMHALDRVEAVGGKTVGVVINLAPTRKARGAYGYGYGYAYGYAPTEGKGASSKDKPSKRNKAVDSEVGADGIHPYKRSHKRSSAR